MDGLPLLNKIVLVTGAARRVGRLLALACGRAGADVVVHHGHSAPQALEAVKELGALGRRGWAIAADLSDPRQAEALIQQAREIGELFALVNSAAIFEPLTLERTTVEAWDRHLAINLTAPFVLSRAFASGRPAGAAGRIVNILDWRALRPGADHFPYTISKAALAALTQSLAVALAPDVTVNGLAFGAILPPSDKPGSTEALKNVPAGRWSTPGEVGEALLFLLSGPGYVTGEILHLDGGRHLI